MRQAAAAGVVKVERCLHAVSCGSRSHAACCASACRGLARAHACRSAAACARSTRGYAAQVKINYGDGFAHAVAHDYCPASVCHDAEVRAGEPWTDQALPGEKLPGIEHTEICQRANRD